jgi:hypothetical protein
MAYYSEHPMKDVIERNEWAATRQIIAQASGRYKGELTIDKFLLTFGGKKARQSPEEIKRNLGLVHRMLKAKKK